MSQDYEVDSISLSLENVTVPLLCFFLRTLKPLDVYSKVEYSNCLKYANFKEFNKKCTFEIQRCDSCNEDCQGFFEYVHFNF